jgi:hypothetical protein
MPVNETAVAISLKILSKIALKLTESATASAKTGYSKWSSEQTLKKALRALNRIENVKTLWSPDKETSLHKFYYPSRIADSYPYLQDDDIAAKAHYKLVESIDDLPPGNLTIEGIVGQGKSIFLRYLGSQMLRKATSEAFPLFIELRTLTPGVNLKQMIFKHLDALHLNATEELFDHLAKSGRVVLLLDAFDELQEELVRDTINEIDHLSTKYDTLKIIVTSRPGNHIQSVPAFRTLRLGPLLQHDYDPFLAKLGLMATKRNDITNAISKNPSRISRIIVTPLMLTLVVIVYESEREIPPNLTDFFDQLFRVVLTRHDRLKAGFNRKHYSGLSERALQQLFEAFCFVCIYLGFGRSLSMSQFSSAFDRASQYTTHGNCTEEKFRQDITKVACLMLEEGLDLTTFLHKSIVEYYAAAFVAHSDDQFATKFYTKCLTNYKQWSSLLTYLKDIDSYRYYRSYGIPETSSLLALVTGACSGNTDESLLALIKLAGPELGISIVQRTGDQLPAAWVIAGYGPIQEPSGVMHARLSNAIYSGMNAAISSKMNNDDISELEQIRAAGQSLIHGDSEIYIKCTAILKRYGPDPFVRSLIGFKDFLESESKRASEFIEVHKQRQALLDLDP